MTAFQLYDERLGKQNYGINRYGGHLPGFSASFVTHEISRLTT